MAMNPNWPRWIKASIAKHFGTILDGDLTMYVEEADRTALNGEKDFCELRIEGPHGIQQGPTDWRLEVEINVLVSSIRSETDMYQLERNNGLITKCFTTVIAILRYGPDPVIDDGQLEGCLILRTDRNSAVVVSNFGAPPDVRILQSSVEGHYKGSPFVST